MQAIIHDARDKIIDLVQVGHFGSIQVIVDVISSTIAKSYAARPGPETHNAVKERFDIALEYMRQLRFDLGWSKQRIIDELPQLLVLYLDKSEDDFKPSERRVWIPSDIGINDKA